MTSERPGAAPAAGGAEPVLDLDITADGAHVYAVTVGRGDGSGAEAQHYRVRVPEALLTELNLAPPDEPGLVRCGLELMLQRPEGPMPAEFSLDEADARYPGLIEQLRTVAGR